MTASRRDFLDRISWGVKPEELALCKSIGVAANLDQQLAPETIAVLERPRFT